jgi:hypothetical protein
MRSGSLTSAEIGLVEPTICVVQIYGQYCPVARAAELLADRWTVLIIRELLADITHFNDLERGLASWYVYTTGTSRLSMKGKKGRRRAPAPCLYLSPISRPGGPTR